MQQLGEKWFDLGKGIGDLSRNGRLREAGEERRVKVMGSKVEAEIGMGDSIYCRDRGRQAYEVRVERGGGVDGVGGLVREGLRRERGRRRRPLGSGSHSRRPLQRLPLAPDWSGRFSHRVRHALRRRRILRDRREWADHRRT